MSKAKFMQFLFHKNRFKSFLWRASMAGLVGFLSYFAAHIGVLDLPTWLELGLGLMAGEGSKAINNWLKANRD